MKIVWDKTKEEKLWRERKISLAEVAAKIARHEIIDFIENPTRKGQHYVLLELDNYVHSAPVIMDEKNERIILKTIFPNRKYHKLYKGKNS